MGPCAKQRVTAVVSHDDPNHDPQSVVIGENVCLTPRALCPRMPGEGYAKCYTHCSQLGHAEEVVLRVVRHLGIPFERITRITVYGHTGPCDNCRSMLGAYGLLDLTEFVPNVVPDKLSIGTQSYITQAYNLNEPSSHSKHKG
jgi:deoxycytidylate deaminase